MHAGIFFFLFFFFQLFESSDDGRTTRACLVMMVGPDRCPRSCLNRSCRPQLGRIRKSTKNKNKKQAVQSAPAVSFASAGQTIEES